MERTKTAIIHAFSELLEEKPYNKITVKDIVERCQINRNTFYYHFEDIPSLLQQVVEKESERLITENYTPHAPIECIRPLLLYCLEHKKALIHVYRYIPMETLYPYLDQIIQHMVEQYFELASQGISAPQEDVTILIRFFKGTMMGILIDWMNKGFSDDIIPDAEHICELLEGTGKRALMKYQEV